MNLEVDWWYFIFYQFKFICALKSSDFNKIKYIWLENKKLFCPLYATREALYLTQRRLKLTHHNKKFAKINCFINLNSLMIISSVSVKFLFKLEPLSSNLRGPTVRCCWFLERCNTKYEPILCWAIGWKVSL